MAKKQLPCDGEGKCMLCETAPPAAEKLICATCATPWHADCLEIRPETLKSTVQWECPDCDGSSAPIGEAVAAEGGLVVDIQAIEANSALSEKEKARRRQVLLSGGNCGSGEEAKGDDNDILAILGENMKCSFCMSLPELPVTTPCGHNFCLKCFEKWVKQGKKTCAKCRLAVPKAMLSQPKINSSLVYAIRMARMPSAAKGDNGDVPRVIQFVGAEELPDKAFTTDRAKRKGNANAKSGRIFVTIPNDHLGPILAEHDPVKKTGVLVGDSWTDRLACRQWGAHFPAIAGIAGQAEYGAQSVVLSGGYADDEDHGEWFLYTGSGGRDLSGNKRTNKKHSSDQKFTNRNEALRLSCRKGYPVRVVRSWKDQHSNYTPEERVVRYDGVYRIEKCWRKNQEDGLKLCRYLFVRCDNSAAPWAGDEHGDRPRPMPCVPELEAASDITERKESPHWDFDENDSCWKWIKPKPMSKLNKKGSGGNGIRNSLRKSSKAKILKEFSCLLCHKVLYLPVTTPCAHNFCKLCLDNAFAGQSFVKDRNRGGRQLRTQKNVMKCPSCTSDISEFLQNAQVNRELMGVIESLMQKFTDEKDSANVEENSAAGEEDEYEEDGDGDEESSEPEVLDGMTKADHDPTATNKKRGVEDAGAASVVAKRGRISQNASSSESPDSPTPSVVQLELEQVVNLADAGVV